MDSASFTRRLPLYLSMLGHANAHNREFAREHYEFFSRMQAYLPELKDKRILEIGCGKSVWLTLLLHSVGAHVTGIDTEVVGLQRGVSGYFSIARTNGMERALRTLVWDLLYARPYYRELAACCPFQLRFADVDARCMQASELEFPDNTFDLAVSHEVFEHIQDVSGMLQALHRAMKPDGITYIYVHNYTSLSGGHHIAWKYPDTQPSNIVAPWDHLRERRHPTIPSWINRMRERDYRKLFEERFEILDWFPTSREGEALLTPEIRAELQDYTEDELLTKGFVVVARPRGK